ncbi:MAG: hypothetical protein AAF697_10205 [Pseudomonadota bacterium]
MYGFAFSRHRERLGQTALEINGWFLEVSDYVPVTELINTQGKRVGAILGWAIDPTTSRLLRDSFTVPDTLHSAAAIHGGAIKPLIGTYIAIISTPDETRIYMDALGNLSVVFDPNNAIAGSTAACVMSPEDYDSRFDSDLYAALEIEKEGWFPAGLTAHKGLERLIANHFLDCDKWEQVRHSAYEQVTDAAGPVEPQFAIIADEIRKSAEASLAAGRKVTVGLTGGGDSRLLLAALKPVRDKVDFYTVAPPVNPDANFDVVRARELSKSFELDHHVLEYVRADDKEANEWDRRVGDCVITANRRQHPSVYPLDGQICIGGLGGEVGRCFLWPDLDHLPPINATSLVDLLKLPRVPNVIERVERWLAQLPATETTKLLDIAYIELRMSAWSSVQSYANPHSVIIHPLASFAAIEAMLRLPPDYRQNDGMIFGFIKQYWPELLDLPINRYGDWRDLKKPLAKITNPTKVFRKLRQIVRTR